MEIIFFGACGAIPSGRMGNVSFLIRGEGFSLLTDVSGNPVQSLLKVGVDPCELDFLFLTHAHTDHLYALPSLFHSLWMLHRSKELLIFTNPETEARAKELLALFSLRERVGLFPYRFVSSVPGSGHWETDRVVVEPFLAIHSVPTFGFRLTAADKRILYTADTAPLLRINHQASNVVVPSDERSVDGVLSRFVGEVDLLIHEASGCGSEEQTLNSLGHSSARQAAETASRLDAPALFLCHVPPEPGLQMKLLKEARAVFQKGIVRIPAPYAMYNAEGMRAKTPLFFQNRNLHRTTN